MPSVGASAADTHLVPAPPPHLVLSGSPGHTPYPHKRGAAPRRLLFKRARSSEDAASASGSSDSSSSSSLLMLPPPPPPFNSPEEGCALPDDDDCDFTPRTKARKLRAALETVAAATSSAAAASEGPEEILRDNAGPRHGIEELSVSVPAEESADGDGEDDILRVSE